MGEDAKPENEGTAARKKKPIITSAKTRSTKSSMMARTPAAPPRVSKGEGALLTLVNLHRRPRRAKGVVWAALLAAAACEPAASADTPSRRCEA